MLLTEFSTVVIRSPSIFHMNTGLEPEGTETVQMPVVHTLEIKQMPQSAYNKQVPQTLLLKSVRCYTFHLAYLPGPPWSKIMRTQVLTLSQWYLHLDIPLWGSHCRLSRTAFKIQAAKLCAWIIILTETQVCSNSSRQRRWTFPVSITSLWSRSFKFLGQKIDYLSAYDPTDTNEFNYNCL